ncbi:MAG: hypothetical protein RR490_05945, partial [Niameybacter sp.]
MKFEKNNKYFTISVYVVMSILLTILGAFLLINFKLMGGYIVAVVKWFFDLIKPLVFGLVIAYLLDPLTELYERRLKSVLKKDKINRAYPTTLTVLTFLVFVTGFLVMIGLNIKSVVGGQAAENFKGSIMQY